MTSNDYLNHWQKKPYRNLWQHPLWADFQKKIGRKTWLLKTDGASALVVKHHLPIGLSWLEVPRGPLFENEKGLATVLDQTVELGKKEGAIFVRVSSYQKVQMRKVDLQLSTHDHHPQTSLIINLSQSEDQILAQMKPKGRYNIKVAEKHGVTVRESDEVNEFYRLLQTTGRRDGFGIHPQSYYEKMLTGLGKNGQLLLATIQGKTIAGGLFVHLDEWGIYYYGASDNEYRHLMAPYLIQWEAMKESKKRGSKYYDFLGIAPENTKNHPWAGVTEFKRKFGGQVADYPPAQEVVLRPFWNWAYRVYKKIRG